MSTIPQVLAGFKASILDPFTVVTRVQGYDYASDSPNVPSVSAYMKTWPFDVTAPATVALWCISGTTEMKGAQAALMAWLSDTGPSSLVALIDANNTLSGVVSSVLPLEVQNWGVVTLPAGQRVLQAELVCEVLR